MSDLPPLEPLPPVDRNKSRAEQLASDLARELSADNGPLVLKQARAALIQAALDKPRQVPGAETTEFKVSMLAIAAGVCLIAVGIWQHDNELTYSGRDLIQWSVAGYAISRGLSKITVPNPPKAP